MLSWDLSTSKAALHTSFWVFPPHKLRSKENEMSLLRFSVAEFGERYDGAPDSVRA